MLIRVVGLEGDNIHRGSSFALRGFDIGKYHDTCKGIARCDRSQVFVGLFPMQNALQINPEAGLLLHFLRIAPKGEDCRGSGIKLYIGVASRWSSFPAMIHRI